MFSARIARKVKPSPVKTFAVLFDATRPILLPFCGKTPAKPAPKRDETLSLTEMRIIDAARRDAYADAVDMVGHEAAEEYAGDVAEQTLTRLRMGRQARRKQHTAADEAWWASQNAGGEPDWDGMAEESRWMDGVEIGAN